MPDVGLKPAPGAGARGPHLVKSPNSAVADAYRVLRTNLIFSSAETTGRVILVTSANPAEGKTTTLANLAVALAQNGAKVLAVDADLRRPTLYQHFGVPKSPGLTDLIVGKAAASEAIHSTRIEGLQLLPCGYLTPNPAELLGSPMMKQIVDALRAHYEWVLIDAPPLLAMADAPVLCPLVDGVVLVIAAESATQAGGDARHRPGAGRRGQGGRPRAQQGQPGAELLLLQPVLRGVLPQLLRRERREALGQRGAGDTQAGVVPAAGAAGTTRMRVTKTMRVEGSGSGTLRLGRMRPLRRAAHVFLALLLALPVGERRARRPRPGRSRVSCGSRAGRSRA